MDIFLQELAARVNNSFGVVADYMFTHALLGRNLRPGESYVVEPNSELLPQDINYGITRISYADSTQFALEFEYDGDVWQAIVHGTGPGVSSSQYLVGVVPPDGSLPEWFYDLRHSKYVQLTSRPELNGVMNTLEVQPAHGYIGLKNFQKDLFESIPLTQ